MLRILFCGGGSIGHLAPSIAVWEAVKKKRPDATSLFVCSGQRADRTFLRSAKVRFFSLHAPKWQLGLSMLFFPILFPLACIEAFCIILFFRPHIIFSKGGYVSVPLCLVGWALFRPIVLHESDRIMGKANRLLVRRASHLCIGTPQKEIANDALLSKIGLPVTATGNPVREEMLRGSLDGGRRVTGFSGKRPVLLVIGGGQGAAALNTAVRKNLEQLILFCDVLHLTGRGKLDPKKTHARYWQRDVLYEEMEHLYAFADVVVSRAGAGAIAELSALGKATILVPLPDLAHSHQEENAHFLQVAQAAIVIPHDLLQKKLTETVKRLMEDPEERSTLGARLRALAMPDAAMRIANVLLETAGK